MTTDCCVRHPLCVEWTTELPSEISLIKSTKFSVEGLEGNLEFTWNMKSYGLTASINSPTRTFLKKYHPVKCFIEHPYKNPPIFFMLRSQELGKLSWEILKSELIGNIPIYSDSNIFIITCLFHSMEPYTEETRISTQTTLNSARNRLQSVSCNVSTFLKSECFSDVKLKCADRNFSAHRLVLAARSEVFAAMFRNKMAETEAGVVDIKDMDPDVLDLLLQYMYSGERPDLCEDKAYRLYEAADMYAVHDLRLVCSDWVVKYQTPENCLAFLVLADEHCDDIFKNAVVRFVAEHLNDLSSESWFALRERYPLLVLSVLEKCMEDSLPGVAKKENFRCLKQIFNLPPKNNV